MYLRRQYVKRQLLYHYETLENEPPARNTSGVIE